MNAEDAGQHSSPVKKRAFLSPGKRSTGGNDDGNSSHEDRNENPLGDEVPNNTQATFFSKNSTITENSPVKRNSNVYAQEDFNLTHSREDFSANDDSKIKRPMSGNRTSGGSISAAAADSLSRQKSTDKFRSFDLIDEILDSQGSTNPTLKPQSYRSQAARKKLSQSGATNPNVVRPSTMSENFRTKAELNSAASAEAADSEIDDFCYPIPERQPSKGVSFAAGVQQNPEPVQVGSAFATNNFFFLG